MSICAVIEPATSLKNARIGYKNLLVSSDTSAADVMLIPNTFERYRPSDAPITVKFQLATLSPVDFVAIGAHNAGTHDGGVDITVSYATTIGGALTQIEVMQFPDNAALMILFDEVSVAEIVIAFDSTTVGLELGVIYAGIALEMERPIYGGHSPIALSAKTVYQSTMSDSGQFLGRTITRQGTETMFSWRHLTTSFYYDEFELFVNSAKTTPAFIMWRPDTFATTASSKVGVSSM